MDWTLFTIGVYGKNENEFFSRLKAADISLLVDVRRRRAVRGSHYAFANSKRLQAGLDRNGIGYRHEVELAPTQDLRAIQKEADLIARKGKRQRKELDPQFVAAYRRQLELVPLRRFVESVRPHGRVVLLCVEAESTACHRSILASEVARISAVSVTHL